MLWCYHACVDAMIMMLWCYHADANALIMMLWCYHFHDVTMLMRLTCCIHHDIPLFHKSVFDCHSWYDVIHGYHPGCDRFIDFMRWKEIMLMIWTSYWFNIVMNACFHSANPQGTGAMQSGTWCEVWCRTYLAESLNCQSHDTMTHTNNLDSRTIWFEWV